MKILLLGEFSGLFNCLKEGLLASGHDVFLGSDGNGYKNYPSDFRWDNRLPKGFSHIGELMAIISNKKLFTGYDAVLVVSPLIFTRYRQFKDLLLKYLIDNNEKVFVSGAGMTPIVFDYWLSEANSKYNNYIKGYFFDNATYAEYLKKPESIKWEKHFIESLNGLIPIWYEYAQPFRKYSNLLPAIRIPINLEKYQYKPNLVHDKIVFFHGIPSRKTSKGTPTILKAFQRMKEKYGDVAEFVTAEHLPFNEYMELLDKTNVIIDDANSYSIAMNGLFSMAKGKIVMGGAEPIANKELGLDNNPVINLCNDVDQICSQIQYIIDNQYIIEELGYRSRKFVEEYHDSKEVSQQYVEVFDKY